MNKNKQQSSHKDNPLKVNIPTDEGQLSMAFTRGGVRDGAGRKAIGVTRKVSITLTSELWQQLEHQCELLSCSRSEWLRGIIEHALEALQQQPQPDRQLSSQSIPSSES